MFTISGSRSVLIDSNILLLFLAGTIDRTSIPRFKRTAQFLDGDFDLLLRVLDRFDRILTTPNILAEVNSLLAQYKLRPRAETMEVFSRVIGVLDERYVESARVARDQAFERLGLTDAGIAILAAENVVVLTDDFALRDSLLRLGLEAVNFNTIRGL